MMPIVTVTHSQ